MRITIPNLSFVVPIGPSGSGKSTFARKHFLPTEVLSSDGVRSGVRAHSVISRNATRERKLGRAGIASITDIGLTDKRLTVHLVLSIFSTMDR